MSCKSLQQSRPWMLSDIEQKKPGEIIWKHRVLLCGLRLDDYPLTTALYSISTNCTALGQPVSG